MSGLYRADFKKTKMDEHCCPPIGLDAALSLRYVVIWGLAAAVSIAVGWIVSLEKFLG
jgi:hypothetical protein